MFFRSPYEYHYSLIQLMQKLGYPSDKEGICHGILMMSIQACATGNIEAFNKRLDFIKSQRNLAEQILQIKKMLAYRNQTSSKPLLSPHEEKVLDVLGFLECIEIHHNARFYGGLFNQPFTQLNSEFIFQFTMSDQLEKTGGLRKALFWPGIYNKEELQSYCKLLDEIAKTVNEPFSLAFSNEEHTTGIHYDPNLPGWYRLEANKLPIHPFKVKADLASWLREVFKEKSKIIAFETIVYLPKNNTNTLEKLYAAFTTSEQFTQFHKITHEKTQYQNARGSTLAFIAAQHGHKQVITDLHAMGADLSKPRNDGATLAIVAAAYNHPLVLKTLADNGVDVNEKTRFGTPLAIATLEHSVESKKFLERWIKSFPRKRESIQVFKLGS